MFVPKQMRQNDLSGRSIGRSFMKRYLQLALSLAAFIAYATFVCAVYSFVRAETANEACGVDCLMRRVDALNGKTAGAGGGCLTFIGPSGDRGGYVSWNSNCTHGTSWTIN
jgi:hypothetical protein